MTALATWIASLDDATRDTERAEAAIRADFAHRIALAADERAIAYRRLNLVRRLDEAVAPAEDASEAEARGLATLRARFDWTAEPDTPHGELAALFAPVCRALWRAGRDQPGEAGEPPAGEALAAFEQAYAARTGSSFWILFDNPMPETPRVDY